MSTARTSYDEVPYDSYPYAQTHPDRLAVNATLFGMKAAPPNDCRVLELGCASGGNLIPMACTLPGSKFVGIDLSTHQVEEGRKTIEALGLTNVELRHLSILDVTPELGRFDYILCHGVYSWVPPQVQDKILEVCARNLAPNGVAYVSYNTYPGWHMRGMIRDIMCYHARDFAGPLLRVQHARNLLDFLAKSVVHPNSPYGVMLRSEVEMIRNKADSYLFHDHMEEVNDPVYFHQFAERAQAKGLFFLCEVDFTGVLPGAFPPEVDTVLRTLSPDVIHMEQYKDFLTNRMFRQTLMSLKKTTPNLALRLDQMSHFLVGSPAKALSASPDLTTNAPEKFEGLNKLVMTAADPLEKAAMVYLTRVWPRCVPFDELKVEARKLASGAAAAHDSIATQDAERLGKLMVTAYASSPNNLVELHLHTPPMAAEVSDQPTAVPLARLQAQKQRIVTNLRHQTVGLSEFDRALVARLDGKTPRPALVSSLAEFLASADINVEIDGKAVREREKLPWAVEILLKQHLPFLAQNALLVS
jgi:methyltransferase-like protein/SAM-dependent methyltransferase